MGHYNSTHAALVEKKHVFGIALLRVRNVKQSSYFRRKWETAFSCKPNSAFQYISLCSKVFVALCNRPLSAIEKRSPTVCVLQTAALQIPIFNTECKFSAFALEHTLLLQRLHCRRWLNGQSHALYHSREHRRLTKQLHYWNTSRNSTAQMRWHHNSALFLKDVQTGVWCTTSPSTSPQKSTKYLCTQSCNCFILCKQSFFALRSMCVLKKD